MSERFLNSVAGGTISRRELLMAFPALMLAPRVRAQGARSGAPVLRVKAFNHMTLSVSDPSSMATGHLVNGSFALQQPLHANAGGGEYVPVGGSSNPTRLRMYSAPRSNDVFDIGFRQSIGANEPLRTGSYSKTLTFTLSTTSP